MRKLLLSILPVLILSGCAGMRASNDSLQEQQTKTIDVIRDVATGIEAFHLNEKNFPVITDGNIAGVKERLVPTYLTALNEKDGWGHPIQYYSFRAEGPYYLISFGADGQKDIEVYSAEGEPSQKGFQKTTSLNDDIIFSNGVFLRYPRQFRIAQEAKPTAGN
jgi:hypothetical protein